MKLVIMAGGQGTRFWPASRRSCPKQFLSLGGGGTLIQKTAGRLLKRFDWADIFVVSPTEYVALVKEQLPALRSDHLIVEPVGRSTAPCIGLAAKYLQSLDGDSTMAVLPADHVIGDTEAFFQALDRAGAVAAKRWLVTFGLRPSYAATGFGYLLKGTPLSGFADQGVFRVDRFIEKPERRAAEEYCKSGHHFWNSGMFCWQTDVLLQELRAHLPELYRQLGELEMASDDGPRNEVFAAMEKVSIDYGLMEKSKRVAMVTCSLQWSDVGNWRAVAELKSSRQSGAAARIVTLDSRGCLVEAGDDKLVALIGVEDLVVVQAGDALLICPLDRAEEVKELTVELESKGLEEFL